MGYIGKNLLLKFIERENESFNSIFEAVNRYALYNKKTLFRKEELQNSRIEPDDTELDYKFADSIIIEDDTVDFDLILAGTFSAQYKSRHDWEEESETIWLRLNCQMVLKDTLISFKVKKIDEYERKNYTKDTHKATASLIPIISREQYDEEAEKFLHKYYPQALKTPMPIPIEEIAKNKLGLVVIKDKLLTAEHAIFGQICFFDGKAKVYDENKNQYVDIEVERGTIFIDPQTYFFRNIGCVNNTIAHESVHWEKHRIFATIKGLLNDIPTVAHRCPATAYGNIIKDKFTEDEAWLEIQANAIAPKILMPKAMTEKKITELISKYDYIPNGECFNELKQIIDDLSAFFNVSKQAAKIRMIELQYHEAEKVYNYDKEFQIFSSEITPLDAYELANTNPEFKEVLDADLDLFRFVENRFVINSPKYIIQTNNGLRLTDFAKLNLNECSLEFQNSVELVYEKNRKHGVLYRTYTGLKEIFNYTNTAHNEEVIDTALDAQKFIHEKEDTKDLAVIPTAAECLAHLIQKRGWNSEKFASVTYLGKDLYSKIRNRPNKEFEINTLVTILIALGYDASVSNMIIDKAGKTMRFVNEEERIYNYLLTHYTGRDILDCNELIEEVNEKMNCDIRLLGGKEYLNTKVRG